jgi:hypothetical protein
LNFEKPDALLLQRKADRSGEAGKMEFTGGYTHLDAIVNDNKRKRK